MQLVDAKRFNIIILFSDWSCSSSGVHFTEAIDPISYGSIYFLKLVLIKYHTISNFIISYGDMQLV